MDFNLIFLQTFQVLLQNLFGQPLFRQQKPPGSAAFSNTVTEYPFLPSSRAADDPVRPAPTTAAFSGLLERKVLLFSGNRKLVRRFPAGGAAWDRHALFGYRHFAGSSHKWLKMPGKTAFFVQLPGFGKIRGGYGPADFPAVHMKRTGSHGGRRLFLCAFRFQFM